MPRADHRKVFIAPDSFFEGHLSKCESVSVEGRFEGSHLIAREIFIGRSGRVRSSLKADSVIVEGTLIGNIEASVRVILMPSARVTGGISTHELIIQKGVLFEGTCAIKNDLSDGTVKDAILETYEKDSAQ